MGSVFTNNSAETLGRVWGWGGRVVNVAAAGHYVNLIGEVRACSRLLLMSPHMGGGVPLFNSTLIAPITS